MESGTRQPAVFVVGFITIVVLWLPPLPFTIYASAFPSALLEFISRFRTIKPTESWPLRWDYLVLPPLFIWALVVTWKSRVSAAEAGLTLRHFGDAWKALWLPTLVGALLLFSIGAVCHSIDITPHFWKRLNELRQPMAIQNYLILPPLFIWACLITWKYRVSAAEAGLTLRHFGDAWKALWLPTLLGALLLFSIGAVCHSIDITPRFWKRLNPLNGLLQQMGIQLFFHRQLMPWYGSGRKTAAILALFFAVLHLPNPALTLGTLFGMYFWARAYQKAPNLYALAISHAFLSAVLMHTMPKAFLPSVSIGWRFVEKGIAHHWWGWFS